MVLGITMQGDKIPIAFIQSTTENSNSIKELLSNLVSRGLRYKNGLLCVIDGSNGLTKAIKEVFGEYALVQRCQRHIRENVVRHLNNSKQDHYRRRINKAYRSEDYQEAKKLLREIISDLKSENLSASRSLEEGLEETLTLHRLVLIEDYGRSFSSTNCIENLNSQIDKHLRKVRHWKTSSQRYRWIACALFDIEQSMKKVHNYPKLPEMRLKLQQHLRKKGLDMKEVV